MLSIEWTLNKISGIKLVFSLLNYQDDARPHKHKMFLFAHSQQTQAAIFFELFFLWSSGDFSDLPEAIIYVLLQKNKWRWIAYLFLKFPFL